MVESKRLRSGRLDAEYEDVASNISPFIQHVEVITRNYKEQGIFTVKIINFQTYDT